MQNLKLCYNDFGHPSDVIKIEKENIRTNLKSEEVILEMLEAPINPSDLIPISGAYKHRIDLPKVAGYEGVGKIISAGAKKKDLLGKRVLPLRNQGTWQNLIKCSTDWFIEVPTHIENSIASRAYINPLTAKLMLKRWPVYNKVVVVTAAGSFFSNFMIQWALKAGANKVIGVYRNPKHISHISELGAKPIALNARDELIKATVNADVCFDAVGGSLADTILKNLKSDKTFVSYGLLSGGQISYTGPEVSIEQFHLRNWLQNTNVAEWNKYFVEMWNLLGETYIPNVEYFKFQDWRSAIEKFKISGRTRKPVLQFR